MKTRLMLCVMAVLLLSSAAIAAEPAVTASVHGASLSGRTASDGDIQFPNHTYERVFVEMRDGVELAVDLWRPVTPKRVKVPVILSLTPYHLLYGALDRNESDLPAGDAALLVPKGYAYARADVRGTYNSGGCWDYGGVNERNDGYDLVEWLGTRDWTNGKVAMTGVSYDGTTANAAAIERPPHLATIVPISAISRWWGYAFQQGARATYSGEFADIDPPGVTPADFMMGYGFAPPPDPGSVSRADQLAMRWNMCGRDEQLTRGYSLEPDYDSYWKDRDYLRLAKRVEVPVLIAHGLQDYNVKTWEGTAWFDALPGEKMMLLGQWAHANPRTYLAEWNELLERWFERWLYGVKNGIEKEPAVRVQSTDGQWYTHPNWGGKTKEYGLSGGEATIIDDGTLTESEMLRGPQSPRFVRVDIEKTEGLRIQGRPVLKLKAASDSTSTHFVAVLTTVAPNGGLDVVSRAFLNARYNRTLAKGEDLEPGKFYDFKLEFIDKDHIVPKGHHLALFIGSSSTTWVAPDQQRATNTIDLSKSKLLLPCAKANVRS